MLLGTTLFDAIRRWTHVRLLLALVVSAVLNLSAHAAWAALPAGGGGGGGISWKVCEPPPVCFVSQAAKDKWAKEHQCQFLDDVCSKTTPDKDNTGAPDEDQGFWGGLWSSIKGSVVYGYEFVKGLVTGLKDQVMDLVHMVTDFDEVVAGLAQLGKAFFDDPKGTLAQLAELLGQEAVDTITRATQCGAYDLGNVIGTYVSPAFALKLASRLTKYSGRLSEAVKVLKHEYGCASFGAGTLVLTPEGLQPIQDIDEGQQVLSRSETSYADRAQEVTHTFGRVAPHHRLLKTEAGSYRLTGEHPLWVQGKGWTEAVDVAVDDVLAGAHGDVLVLANEAVDQPLRVYNFSVDRTTSYFIGAEGIWAHNATCRIDLDSKAFNKLEDGKARGFRGELEVFKDLKKKGYEPVGKSFDPGNKSMDVAFKEWDGQTGIDAIYKDKKGNYVIVESKATGGKKMSDPEGCVAKLCTMQTGERQMSDKWIDERLDALVTDPVERQIIRNNLTRNNGVVSRVYAQTDGHGTQYNVIDRVNANEVKIGKTWEP
jgi:hypothetical protein